MENWGSHLSAKHRRRVFTRAVEEKSVNRDDITDDYKSIIFPTLIIS